jgi:hypothetical protein
MLSLQGMRQTVCRKVITGDRSIESKQSQIQIFLYLTYHQKGYQPKGFLFPINSHRVSIIYVYSQKLLIRADLNSEPKIIAKDS